MHVTGVCVGVWVCVCVGVGGCVWMCVGVCVCVCVSVLGDLKKKLSKSFGRERNPHSFIYPRYRRGLLVVSSADFRPSPPNPVWPLRLGDEWTLDSGKTCPTRQKMLHKLNLLAMFFFINYDGGTQVRCPKNQILPNQAYLARKSTVLQPERQL